MVYGQYQLLEGIVMHKFNSASVFVSNTIVAPASDEKVHRTRAYAVAYWCVRARLFDTNFIARRPRARV